MTNPLPATASVRQSLLSGLDAALIVTALGIMYALIVYAPLGPSFASAGLKTVVAGVVVGGGIAMLLGREIAVVAGPTATSALVVAAMVEQLVAAGLIDGAHTVVVVTALAGIGAGLVPLVLARARLGVALKFVPYPVLMGFVNAIGVSFVISALPLALGHDGIGRAADVASWFATVRPFAVVVALVGTVVGYAAVFFLPRAPAAFIALVAATLAHHVIAARCADCALGPLVRFGDFDALPDYAGAATSGWPALGRAGWAIVVQAAVTLGILNAVFSMMTAAALTRPHDLPVDGNRLLAKVGGGTVASALALGLPIAIIASVSKAVRNPAARTSTALAVYLAATTLVFAFAARLFALIPMAAVASAVLVIARMQFDLSTGPLLRQALRGPAARRAAIGPLAIMALVVTVAVVRSLAAALFVGALAAVCLLALDLRRSVVLSVHDGRRRASRRVWAGLARERLDASADRIRVVEIAHWLYFGTADELVRILDDQAGARWLLLDAHRVAGIDLTAARSLVRAAQRLASRGSHLVLAGIPADDARLRAITALRVDGGLALEVAADVDEALEAAEADLIGHTTGEAWADGDAPAASVPGLDATEAARLDRWLVSRRLAAGETLFRAGDPGDALFVVRSGRITLWVDGEQGRRMRLLTFGQAGLFGEMALLDGRPRSAHAGADEDSELAVLTRDRLGALAAADPPLHARLLRALSLQLIDRLRATTTMLQQSS